MPRGYESWSASSLPASSRDRRCDSSSPPADRIKFPPESHPSILARSCDPQAAAAPSFTAAGEIAAADGLLDPAIAKAFVDALWRFRVGHPQEAQHQQPAEAHPSEINSILQLPLMLVEYHPFRQRHLLGIQPGLLRLFWSAAGLKLVHNVRPR